MAIKINSTTVIDDSRNLINIESATFTGTSSIKLPAGTDDQRPITPVDGMMRYNTTANTFEGRAAAEWGAIGGSSGYGNVIPTSVTTNMEKEYAYILTGAITAYLPPFPIVGDRVGILPVVTGSTLIGIYSNTTSAINVLEYVNGKYLYGGAGGVLAESTSGGVWTARTSGTTSAISSITYGNGLYLYGGAGGILGTSTNATNWTANASGLGGTVNALTYGNNLYVAGTNNATNAIGTSTNGVNWTLRSSGTSQNVTALIYNSDFRLVDQTTYAGSFDGVGDYVNVADSTLLDLSGDFNIECWAYWIPRTGETFPTLLSKGNYQGGLSEWVIRMNASNGSLSLSWNTGTGFDIASLGTITSNQWNHIAVSRSGTLIRTFLNGSLVSTQTATNDFTSTAPLRIGADEALITNEQWSGFISNVRVIKNTALYISSFTPATSPLTVVSGTSLLTCNSATLADISGNALIVTAVGNTGIGSIPYVAGVGLYANYFDGVGDYVNVADSAVLDLSGDFNIECWVYRIPRTGETFPRLISKGNYQGGAAEWLISLDTSTNVLSWNYGTTNVSVTIGTISSNEWNHIAVSRSGTSFKTFVNGILINTQTVSVNFTSVAPIRIGGDESLTTNEQWSGYISNVRIIKGSALYTATFSVPTSPLTPLAGTSLLICNSSTIVDNSGNAGVVTAVGNAAVARTVVSQYPQLLTEYKQYIHTTAAGLVKTSTNAINWSTVYSPGVGQYALTYKNNLYITAGTNGSLSTSTNGINWTTRTSNTSNQISKVAYGNGLYVYTGVGGALGTSTDGINWTPRSSGNVNSITALTYGLDRFVYGDSAGGIQASTSGIDWSPGNKIMNAYQSITVNTLRSMQFVYTGLDRGWAII